MKGKFKIVIIVAITLVIGILFYNQKDIIKSKLTTERSNKAVVSIDDGDGKYHQEDLNKSIIKTQNGKFSLNADDILIQSAKLLGTNYKWGKKGGNPYNGDTVKSEDEVIKDGVDCSGLVWWTLKCNSVKLQLGQGVSEWKTKSAVPIDCKHWLGYLDSNNNTMEYKEIGVWNRENKDEPLTFNNKENISHTSVYNKDKKIDVNGKKQDINVLKINDPITSNYRWFEYYDGETKKELPAGTVVVAYSGSKNAYNHSWIAIGNLGTSNETEAANILVSRGIINEYQKKYVKSYGNSEYWRIEASADKGKVIIDNNNEDYFSMEGKDGIIKKIGPIWAFQVANYTESTPATFNALIDKVDENGDEVEGVEFTSWCKKDKDTSNLGVGNKLVAYNDTLMPDYQTVSYSIANGETKYLIIEETAVPQSKNGKIYGKYDGYIIIKATRTNNKTTLTLEDYPDVLIDNIKIDGNSVRFTMTNYFIHNDKTTYNIGLMKYTKKGGSKVEDSNIIYSTWSKTNDLLSDGTIKEKISGEQYVYHNAVKLGNEVHLNQSQEPAKGYSVEDVYRFKEKDIKGLNIDPNIYELKIKKTSNAIR